MKMQAFPLNLERFAGVKNAAIKRPTVSEVQAMGTCIAAWLTDHCHQEIAHFSYDDDHVFHAFSDVSLRYYYPPPVNVPGQDHRFPVDLCVVSPTRQAIADAHTFAGPKASTRSA